MVKEGMNHLRDNRHARVSGSTIKEGQGDRERDESLIW